MSPTGNYELSIHKESFKPYFLWILYSVYLFVLINYGEIIHSLSLTRFYTEALEHL